MRIILATGSPYRREAFSFLNLDFIAESSSVDEDFEGRPSDPVQLVKELAKRKAENVAGRYSQGIIVGFDSVGWFEGEILEKPKSREEAFDRLKRLSGKSFQFITGIHMINTANGKVMSKVVKTGITMRPLQEGEIKKYLDEDLHYTTYSPGFDPLKNYSSTFARSVTGSYNNFTRGIPLESIVEMLIEIGYKVGRGEG